jgi:hypothetical protein
MMEQTDEKDTSSESNLPTDNRRVEVVLRAVILSVFAQTLCGLRLATRALIVRRLQADDYMIIGAMVRDIATPAAKFGYVKANLVRKNLLKNCKITIRRWQCLRP